MSYAAIYIGTGGMQYQPPGAAVHQTVDALQSWEQHLAGSTSCADHKGRADTPLPDAICPYATLLNPDRAICKAPVPPRLPQPAPRKASTKPRVADNPTWQHYHALRRAGLPQGRAIQDAAQITGLACLKSPAQLRQLAATHEHAHRTGITLCPWAGDAADQPANTLAPQSAGLTLARKAANNSRPVPD